MKKLVSLSAVAIMMVAMVSCGGSKAEVKKEVKKSRKTEVNVLRQSSTPTPDWVEGAGYQVAKDGNTKVIYIKVEAERPTKMAAKAAAEADKIKQMANAIKQLATTEFAVARQGMGQSEAGLDEYIEETIAAVSKNVNVGGALQVSSYWEQVEMIKHDDSSKEIFRYVLRYSIDYATFTAAMKNQGKSLAGKITNPELKNKAQKVLSSITEE